MLAVVSSFICATQATTGTKDGEFDPSINRTEAQEKYDKMYKDKTTLDFTDMLSLGVAQDVGRGQLIHLRDHIVHGLHGGHLHQQTDPDGHNQQQQQQRQHQEDSGQSEDFIQKLRLGLFNIWVSWFIMSLVSA